MHVHIWYSVHVFDFIIIVDCMHVHVHSAHVCASMTTVFPGLLMVINPQPWMFVVSGGIARVISRASQCAKNAWNRWSVCPETFPDIALSVIPQPVSAETFPDLLMVINQQQVDALKIRVT